MISIFHYQSTLMIDSFRLILHNPGKADEGTEIPRDRHFRKLKNATSLTVLYTSEPMAFALVATFKLLFTFHSQDKLPQKLKSGYYSCSVEHYNSCRKHFDCTNEFECNEKIDEGSHCFACNMQLKNDTNCPFCLGVGDSLNGKCYLTVPITTPSSDTESFLTTASQACE
jgi:hypothetical protein